MSERPVVPCQACEAPLIWALDKVANEHIAVDAVPVYGGNVALEINANTVPIAHSGTMAHTFAQNRTDLHTPHKGTCAGRPPRPPAHAFAVDERVPADWHGRRWCICGLPGEPGDDRHPADAAPLRLPPDPAVVAQAAADRDAAILGEREADADLLALARRIFQQGDPPPASLADRVIRQLTYPDGVAADQVLGDLHGRDTAS